MPCFFLYLWGISGELAHCVLGLKKSKGNLAGADFCQFCCSVQASSWKFPVGRVWGLSPFPVLLSVGWARNTGHILHCQCFCASTTGAWFSIGNPWERCGIFSHMEHTWHCAEITHDYLTRFGKPREQKLRKKHYPSGSPKLETWMPHLILAFSSSYLLGITNWFQIQISFLNPGFHLYHMTLLSEFFYYYLVKFNTFFLFSLLVFCYVVALRPFGQGVAAIKWHLTLLHLLNIQKSYISCLGKKIFLELLAT